MNFVILQFFDNYIDAHIVLGRLQDGGINCWLKDENISTLFPYMSQYKQGIKLMVAESQAEQALQILNNVTE
jgi:hypothetical protein